MNSTHRIGNQPILKDFLEMPDANVPQDNNPSSLPPSVFPPNTHEVGRNQDDSSSDGSDSAGSDENASNSDRQSLCKRVKDVIVIGGAVCSGVTVVSLIATVLVGPLVLGILFRVAQAYPSAFPALFSSQGADIYSYVAIVGYGLAFTGGAALASKIFCPEPIGDICCCICCCCCLCIMDGAASK
jgi:hypothetical protein